MMTITGIMAMSVDKKTQMMAPIDNFFWAAVLGRHPAGRQCVVFGLDDAKWGEAVNTGLDGATAPADDIISFVKQYLE